MSNCPPALYNINLLYICGRGTIAAETHGDPINLDCRRLGLIECRCLGILGVAVLVICVSAFWCVAVLTWNPMER